MRGLLCFRAGVGMASFNERPPMLTAAVISALSLLHVAPIADAKDDQWLYRDLSGEGPVASFLSWNYSTVITRAHCANGQVALEYFHDASESPTLAERPPTLLIDEVAFKLTPSTDRRSRQVYTLSADGKAALRRARNVDLDAPNEMDEPWYMGRAGALVQLAERCG